MRIKISDDQWIWLFKLIGGFLLFGFLYGIALSPSLLEIDAAVSAAFMLVFIILVTLAYVGWIKLTEKRKCSELSLRKLLPDTIQGLATGSIYFITVVGIMMLLGAYSIKTTDFNAGEQLKNFVFFFGVAVCEEIMFRGILFRMMDRKWGFVKALIISALLFGFVHITNDNATLWSAFAISIEAGLLFGTIYKWCNNLWMPIGIHWAWNYLQGNVFGFEVSGTDSGSSIITPEITGHELITGGSFGAEASVISVIIGIAFTLFFLQMIRKGELIKENTNI
ncbi:CPBP family intramembrane glutamic endopeptidase [Prevotella sp. HUN102]|uniref:CPBP family intramembrane glutamic endopeptidase n=1 Tax=Prevotella sp. HUN102 TaxID=1392486 RepID=UPI00068F8164|nr:type II CAAX endopeptidase family protein [Prevotella sp. HUN102]